MRTTSLAVPGADHAVRDVTWFAGLALLLTAAAAAGATALGPGLQFLLALGPAVIALVLAWRTGTLRQLIGTIRKRPAERRWYAVAILVPVIVSLGVVAVVMVLGMPNTGFLSGLTVTAAILPLVVFLPALAEEFAWRGFAFARLLGSMSPLAASLVLAAPWAVVHLALYLPGQPLEGTAVWPSVVSIVAMSVLTGWLYVRTGGSVLITTLFHTASNATTPLTWSVDPAAAWAIRPVLLGVFALAIVVLGGLRSPEPRRSDPRPASPALTGAVR